MNSIQQQLSCIKGRQRTGFHALLKESELIERDLEVFLEHLAAPAWNDGPQRSAPAKAMHPPAQSTEKVVQVRHCGVIS
jgi:hypothetical protein